MVCQNRKPTNFVRWWGRIALGCLADTTSVVAQGLVGVFCAFQVRFYCLILLLIATLDKLLDDVYDLTIDGSIFMFGNLFQGLIQVIG